MQRPCPQILPPPPKWPGVWLKPWLPQVFFFSILFLFSKILTLLFWNLKYFFINNLLGASADEIAATMQEALNASLGNIDEDRLEEMLDVADTVARYVLIAITYL